MPIVVKDNVKETTSTTGNGTWTLTGAVANYRSFADIGNANQTFYTAFDPNSGAKETGIGTYTLSGTTLSRDLVISNSLGTTAKISFVTAPIIWCDLPASAAGTIITPEMFGGVGDGATDNATALGAFRTWALALNTSSPATSIVLTLARNATYLCSNPLLFAGINNLIVQGNGASIQNTASGSANFLTWWLGGIGYLDNTSFGFGSLGYSINDTSYLIGTANAGDSQVTCSTHAQAANMTAGQWALVSSSVCIYQGSPPAMRFFDYVKVLTVNSSTGVVTFDRPLANTHLSTLPANLASGTFPSAATIFPLGSAFGCRQWYKDVNFLASLHTPANNANYAILQGEAVFVEGGSFGGGVTPSNIVRGCVAECPIAGFTGGGNSFEVDKLVGQFKFKDLGIKGNLTLGNPSIGPFEFDGVTCAGNLIHCGPTMRIKNSKFAQANLLGCLTGVFENNFPSQVSLGGTSTGSIDGLLNVDGSTVTYSAGVITIPYTALATFAIQQFVCSIWVGCILDIDIMSSGLVANTGGVMVVNSITDDATNIYIGVDVASLTCTAAAVNAGGTGYTNGDTLTLPNGVKGTATASGGVISALTITQPYASKGDGSAITATGGSGTGATFNLTFGIPSNTYLGAPQKLSYSGRGNIGGDVPNFTSGATRTFGGFLNGDTGVLIGNKRTGIIAPLVGASVNYNQQSCRGRLKNIHVNVIRPYTGSQFSVNSLFLWIHTGTPVFQEFLMKTNLSLAGERQAALTGAFGALSGDVIPSGAHILSSMTIFIGQNSGPITFTTDTQQQLPIIEVDIEIEDEVHNLPR